MKQRIFTLMMMLALVIVAGSAFGQVNGGSQKPYAGSKHTYHLTGMSVNTTGSVLVDYTGNGETISKPRTNVASGDLAGAGPSYTFPSGQTEIYFDITYSTTVAGADGNITVTLTEGATGTCSNYIRLAIDVIDAPTLALDITTSNATVCQNVTNTNNNEAGSLGMTTTFTLTVDPTWSTDAVSEGATYGFDLNLNDYLIGATAVTIIRASGDGTATPAIAVGGQIVITNATIAQTFTVSFTTTPSVSEGITATIDNYNMASNGSSFTVTGSSDNVVTTIQYTPAIGSFQGLN
jgi:hypothetical protein